MNKKSYNQIYKENGEILKLYKKGLTINFLSKKYNKTEHGIKYVVTNSSNVKIMNL